MNITLKGDKNATCFMSAVTNVSYFDNTFAMKNND